MLTGGDEDSEEDIFSYEKLKKLQQKKRAVKQAKIKQVEKRENEVRVVKGSKYKESVLNNMAMISSFKSRVQQRLVETTGGFRRKKNQKFEFAKGLPLSKI